MNEESRNYQIENLRAIAILMVVFGHSVIIYSGYWPHYHSDISVPSLAVYKQLTNLIQMPLFFSISGFLFELSGKKSFFTFLRKKSVRLLIPYFVVGLMWMIPIRMAIHFPDYAENGIKYAVLQFLTFRDIGHLWFLPCLFCIFMIAYAFNRLISHCTLPAQFMIISVSSVVSIYLSSFFNPLRIMVNFPWFMFGYLISRMNIEGQISENILIFRIILIMVLAGFCIMYVLNDGFSWSSLEKKPLNLALLCSSYLLIPKKKNKILSFIGKNSFGIYLFHSPLVYITFSKIPNADPVFVVFLNFIVFGTVALMMTVLIRKTPLKLIIGE